MFTGKEKPKYQRMIESECERAIRSLASDMTDSEEYAKKLKTVERLHDLLPEERHSFVSKDTMANVGANLFGIFMILKHESVNVITSKALSFVIRTKT